MEMKRKMEGKMGINNSLPISYPVTGIFGFREEEGEKSNLGFMELLSFQDHPFTSFLFDWPTQGPQPLPQPPSLPPLAEGPLLADSAVKDSPEVFNHQPATPNSSSISSASSEAANEERTELTKVVDHDEDRQGKTIKQLKAKKTNDKRQKREPRFAFMTKSEVDHLEDGYRWRKYGQKAVKNSPFPRSYYRCTTSSCNVKKRVERSYNDPTIVVTTYEGQHTHPNPVITRSSFVTTPTTSLITCPTSPATNFGMPMGETLSQYQHHPLTSTLSFPLNFGCHNDPINGAFSQGIRRSYDPAPGLVKDHGLLEDIIPYNMLKQE